MDKLVGYPTVRFRYSFWGEMDQGPTFSRWWYDV